MQKTWVAGTVAHHPELNCVEPVRIIIQKKGEPNLKIPFLSLRYFAYFESENVASFFTYTTPDHKSELNTTSKDSEKLMIGLREHFLLPPSIEVTFAHLFLVN